jgi:hypothetical protein
MPWRLYSGKGESYMKFDLQRFADDSEGYSIDEALSVLNGTNEPPAATEPAQEQPDTQTPETQPEQEQQPDNEPGKVETEEPAEQQTEPEQTPDFNQVIKFKENGQEVELTLAQLIDRAQKGSNYERRMQEVAQQQKAFEASLQQQQANQQNDPAKQFEELNNKVTARAMQMLGIQNSDEFIPDATGMIGDKVHYAAYQKGKEYLASFNPSEGNRHINHSDLFKQTQVAMRRNHGTLPWPEVEFDVNKLSKYGDIHHIRKLADYQEDVIDESQAQECINFAKEVNNILKKYWHKR